MKKFLPYILIVLIFVQLLAPFTIGSGVKNNLEIRSNKAEAADSIRVRTTADTTDRSIIVGVRVVWGENGWRTGSEGVVVTLLNSSNEIIDKKTVELVDVPKDEWLPEEIGADMVQKEKALIVFPDLASETTYGINTVASQDIVSWWTILKTAGLRMPPIPDTLKTTIADPNPLEITTREEGGTTPIPAGQQISVNENSILPTCDIMSLGKTFGGCVGRFFYWAFFKPTSYIFALTGRLLDVSVDYSVKDTSYRSPFVVEGWGVVRDFCNMFFIFILLYIAFGTILNLHSVKTKEMIIRVVIIGLLINFSLFATQIIIDTSNILTRVFYNSQTIEIGPMDNGIIQNQVGSQGEIQLSLALVGKINPQRLILDAGRADNIQTKNTISGENEERMSNRVSVGTFILVTILASIVNVVGIITFLFCALIFISRVIGLWLAMIFAPFAFFSYTVPAMQEFEMVGWKKWWPETLKLAFLAPVFIFFIYLIIKFLDTGLGLLINDEKGGLDFLLGIFVPFIFIMILLTKAKDIAKRMSGTVGQSVTNGLAKIGGVALGAGIGGLAMAGRQTIGRWAANATQNNAFKDWAGRSRIGAGALKMASGVASKSFDFRGTKLAGMTEKGLGTDLGKAKQGGFTKIREEKIKKEEEFAKKLLDTSDYGKIKLTSQLSEGKISNRRANQIIQQMKKAGGDRAQIVTGNDGKTLNSSALRAQLKANPEKYVEIIADELSSARRTTRADKLSRGSITNKIAADKIRKDPTALKKARDSAAAFKKLSEELKKSEGNIYKKEESKVETQTPDTSAPNTSS